MQGVYKFGKIKFPEISRPSKQLFPDNYKDKTRRNELTHSYFGRFLAEVQNILFTDHGDWLHPCHYCATQPIHATVTDSYAQNSMSTITLTKIP